MSLVKPLSSTLTLTQGLSALHDQKPDWALATPTLFSAWIICRCRLVTSTVSPSQRVMEPTPAAARYRAAGDPRPPTPTMSTLAFLSFACPSMPKPGSDMWRAYRSSSCVESWSFSPSESWPGLHHFNPSSRFRFCEEAPSCPASRIALISALSLSFSCLRARSSASWFGTVFGAFFFGAMVRSPADPVHPEVGVGRARRI